MLGFQAAGAAPIVLGHPVEKPQTFATAIRIGNPASWKTAEAARDESGGVIDMVTDDEIRAAYRKLAATEGVFAEPASAATIAGIEVRGQGLFRCVHARDRDKLRLGLILTDMVSRTPTAPSKRGRTSNRGRRRGCRAPGNATASTIAGRGVKAMPYGLIFDVDGVLADTEALIARATIAMYRELYGLELTPEDLLPYVGTGAVRYTQGPAEERGLEIELEMALRKRYENLSPCSVGRLHPSRGASNSLDRHASGMGSCPLPGDPR